MVPLSQAPGTAGGRSGPALFLGAAAVGVAVTVMTEALSLADRLTSGWVIASWALVGVTVVMVVVWAIRARRARGDVRRRERWWPDPLALGVGVILAATALTAVLAPPNTWDSMTYHMPRVMHWAQAGSVAHYPTHVPRQIWQGPWAEFAIAHLYLLGGSDRLANLVQWLAFAGCVVGGAHVAGELGGGRRARMLAALTCATLPMAIAQATSTQNDLVTSFWVLSLGYAVLRFRREPGPGWAALVGVTVALVGLTKGPAWVLVAPWLGVFLVLAARLGRGRAMRWIALAACCAGALMLGHAARGVAVLMSGAPPVIRVSAGSRATGEAASTLSVPVRPPTGPRVAWLYVNTTLDPRALVSNVVRNAALHLATTVDVANIRLAAAVAAVHDAMGIDLDDDRTTYGAARFHVYRFPLQEDLVGNPAHFVLALAAAATVWWRRDAFGRPLRLWLAMIVAGALAFCLVMKWQPWHSRLHLPLFVLAAPLVGCALEAWGRRRAGAAVTAVVAVTVWGLALPSLAYMRPRPLLGPASVLATPRVAQMFANRPDLQAPYEGAARAVGALGCRRVGLVLATGDDWEYPFWALLRDRTGALVRIEHVLVQNSSARLAPATPGAPCALIAVGRGMADRVAWAGTPFVVEWSSDPVRVYRAAG